MIMNVLLKVSDHCAMTSDLCGGVNAASGVNAAIWIRCLLVSAAGDQVDAYSARVGTLIHTSGHAGTVG